MNLFIHMVSICTYYIRLFHKSINFTFIYQRLYSNIQYYFTPSEFFTHLWLVVFLWSLSDSKFPQISRTFLSILGDLNNAVVWMLSILPLISYSFSPFSKPFGPFQAHQFDGYHRHPLVPHFFFFFSFLASFKYLFIILFYSIFLLWSTRAANSTGQVFSSC